MTDRYEKIRKALAKGPMQGPWGATLRDLLAERDALAAEVEALRAEAGRLQQQYDERTACMIVHRGQALACSDAVRAAYFDESRRADKLADALAGLITWAAPAATYRRLGFDPDAPMRALAKARAALAKGGEEVSND